MKKRLLSFLICPICLKPLSLKVFEGDERGVKEGLLFCDCGQFFPVVGGIPRILVGDLRGVLYQQFPEFFLKYRKLLPKERLAKMINKDSLQKEKTLQSFGYEWQKFSQMLQEWQKNFNFYFEPLANLNILKDKIILEAGCGKGRHTFYASKYAKEFIAIDLSQAVDVAFHNNRGADNCHFLQADIYNLPFRKNSFDFIFSLGVLHHLPKPQDGFQRLVRLLKDRGSILIYVYHSFPPRTFNFYALKVVNLLRGLTSKLPLSFLYLLCYPIAILSYLIFVLPAKFFFREKTPLSWPLKQYTSYSFQVLLNDTFDRFSAPIENRYSEKEVLNWFQKANLKEIKILSGWRAFGKKA